MLYAPVAVVMSFTLPLLSLTSSHSHSTKLPHRTARGTRVFLMLLAT
jgi:hypothetical protein